MIIEGNRRIHNGIAISVETIKLLFRNPILLVYTLVPVLLYVTWPIFIETPDFIPSENLDGSLATYHTALKAYTLFSGIVRYVIGTFFGCCLARHAMHILRKQPASVRESCMWVLQHYQQIVAWILIVVLFSKTWFLLLPEPISVVFLIGGFIASVFFLGFLSTIFLLFTFHIVAPIVSTETIGILPAIKRSSRTIWNHFGTYLTMIITLSVIIVAMYFIVTVLVESLLNREFALLSREPIWLQQPVSMFVNLLIVIIADTIFYYEFYVKRELELEDIHFTQQM